MAKILIGLWSYHSRSRYGRPVAEIVSELRLNVGRCRAQLAGLESRRKSQLQAIFVAPEYLFTAKGASGRRESMKTQQKDLVELSLKQISAQYPNILLIAGTVFYHERVIDEARKRFAGSLISNELELKKAYVNEFRPYANLSMVQISQVDIEDDLDSGRVDYDMLTRAQKSRLNDLLDNMNSWEQNGIKVPGLLAIAEGMASAEKAKRRQFRARNCAYLFLNGQRLGVYDKHSDFQETMGARPAKLAFLPGTADQAPEADGLRFGVEICFDHGNGLLKRRGLSNLDFHVVVSDSVTNNFGNLAMKRGGYFLHASTNPSETTVVFQATNGALVEMPLDPTPAKDVLSFCTIDEPS